MTPQEKLSRATGTRHKYRAKRTTVYGKSFASKAEAKAYADLRLLEQARHISGIVCQHPLVLHTTDMKGIKRKIGVHLVDFSYWDCITKERRYLECKGVDLAFGKWKRRAAELEYNIVIELRKT